VVLAGPVGDGGADVAHMLGGQAYDAVQGRATKARGGRRGGGATTRRLCSRGGSGAVDAVHALHCTGSGRGREWAGRIARELLCLPLRVQSESIAHRLHHPGVPEAELDHHQQSVCSWFGLVCLCAGREQLRPVLYAVRAWE